MNATLTRDWIFRRFTPGASPAAKAQRGDHSLNPGTGPGEGLIPAAVLIPLVDRPGGLTVLFTQRTDHLDNHAGQISFPGGQIEEIDATPEGAAIRETQEEIGLDPGRIEILGRLEDYVSRTNFIITPVVGVVTPPFDLTLDDHEVAGAFEVPLNFLLDPANHQRHHREVAGTERMFYAMPYKDYFIWGVTAGILMSFYEHLSNGK